MKAADLEEALEMGMDWSLREGFVLPFVPLYSLKRGYCLLCVTRDGTRGCEHTNIDQPSKDIWPDLS